jgi:hypothetical protein
MGDLMKLKRVQFFMSKQSYLASLLAIAALVCYFIGYASIAITYYRDYYLFSYLFYSWSRLLEMPLLS